MKYTQAELTSLYELGRMYFEMGYFAPSERIFHGLAVVDGGSTPARLGLALIKLERGLYDESLNHFRAALQHADHFALQTKLGLCVAFIAQGEFSRAKSVLLELRQEVQHSPDITPALRDLHSALETRCEER